MYLYLTIGYLIGMAAGYFITVSTLKRRYIGTMRMHNSDPDEEPYLFLELNKGIDDFYRSEYVTLRVDVKGVNTHN